MNLTNLNFCNATAEYEEIIETPLWHDYTFHQFGLALSAAFGGFAIVLSIFLIWRHATHYLKPHEQKYIIRILFMVPIYSVVSFLSYVYYIHSVYFDVLRDCYEAFTIASFFALLCNYIAPELHDQKEFFRGLEPKPWVWPMTWFKKCCGGQRGWARTPRSGLTWFNTIYFLVFQYCLVRVVMTLTALVSQVLGRYCLDSLSPLFLHLWVAIIEAISVTCAMFCLIQFYVQIRLDLARHRPLLKVIAIKLVIFLCFWQSLIINFLTSSSVIKESPQIALPDIKIGIPALLLCIEMAIFSVLHLFAYPWNVYDVRSPALELPEGHSRDPKVVYTGGFMGLWAIADACNPWDIIKAIGRGFRWMFVGRKTRELDKSYSRSSTTPFVPAAKKQDYELVGTGNDNEFTEPNSSSTHSLQQSPQKAYSAYSPGYTNTYNAQSTTYPTDENTYHAQSALPYPEEPSAVKPGRGANHETIVPAVGAQGEDEWAKGDDTSYHGAALPKNEEDWTHAR